MNMTVEEYIFYHEATEENIHNFVHSDPKIGFETEYLRKAMELCVLNEKLARLSEIKNDQKMKKV